MSGLGDHRFETAADLGRFDEFLQSPGGTPENLAGNLIQELQALSVGQFDLLKQKHPQYSAALEQAMNQGKSQSEPSTKARMLVALLKEDYPAIVVSELIKIVRKIKEQP